MPSQRVMLPYGKASKCLFCARQIGAGEGLRTFEPSLGKVVPSMAFIRERSSYARSDWNRNLPTSGAPERPFLDHLLEWKLDLPFDNDGRWLLAGDLRRNLAADDVRVVFFQHLDGRAHLFGDQVGARLLR